MLSAVSSITTITSITTVLPVGVTVGSALLCFVLIGLLISKELSITYPSVDKRVKDSLNAAILPTLFAFLALVAIQVV